MIFVPANELKTGMRLAKPIYNKKGVLLYERDTKLTSQGITSIRHFGLIGIYVLEPAEPLPPMTEEDREFERFQTMSVFRLKEIMNDIQMGKNPKKLSVMVSEILKIFGKYKGKITFMQNLRSAEDNVYKHSLNVAILAAAISGKMDISYEEQSEIVAAALLHDIGSLDIPDEITHKASDELTEDDWKVIEKYKDDGYRLLRDNCDLDSGIMKNISYLLRDLKELRKPTFTADKKPEDLAVEILKASYMFDILTAMKYGEPPQSDIAAYRYLRHPRNRMNQKVITGLTYAINIVPSGCSVQFENGVKGIVLTENEDDILRPFVLSFLDNQIYNLADGKTYEKYQIKDVLKTLDNRYIMMDEYKKYLDRLNNGEEAVAGTKYP